VIVLSLPIVLSLVSCLAEHGAATGSRKDLLAGGIVTEVLVVVEDNLRVLDPRL